MIDLQNKIVVVTGGEGLLGKAFVDHARRAGATALSADVKCRHDLNNGACRMDITDEASVRSCVTSILQKFGRIDGWVNNAYPRTADWGSTFEMFPFASVKQNLSDHLGGYFLCAQVVLEQMKKQRAGSFINMGSIYGFSAPDFSLYEGTDIPSLPVYHAIKGGVVQLTRYLASLYGPHGVRVNTLSPSGVLDQQHPTFVEKYEAKLALRRMASPNDIASPAVFLLSDAAGYITGHNLVVDGGWSMQ